MTGIRTPTKKKFMIEALIRTLGNISAAVALLKKEKELTVARATHYSWMKKDPSYKKKVEEIPEQEVEFYEQALRKQIEQGSVQAIIFALKSKGRNKGWKDTSEQNINLNGGLNVRPATELWDEIQKRRAEENKKN